ncbi:MAG: patatin-like phospholipase family protein, partial [Acidimicrobiia bacterium]
MEPKVVNGVFEGGGIRGIALAGAAAGAMDQGYRFARVAGTSAGALVASLIAAGYEADELSEAVCQVDWPGLLDSVPGRRIPLVGNHLALVLWKGMYHGDRLEEAWRELLARKGVRTFGDLEPGSLRVVVTDVTHQKGVVFPEGLEAYGIEGRRFPVARAVHMSSAVPFVFRPVPLYDLLNGERVFFADGALASNFPVRLVGGERPVLGFRLTDADSDHPHEKIRGPASLARAVVGSGIRAREGLPGYSTN